MNLLTVQPPTSVGIFQLSAFKASMACIFTFWRLAFVYEKVKRLISELAIRIVEQH